MYKIIIFLVLIFIYIILISNCTDPGKNPTPVTYQFLTNTDVEEGTSSPYNWALNEIGDCTADWDNTVFQSSSHSLRISNSVSDAGNWGNCNQSVTEDIPVGKNPVLKVSIKTNNITGAGGAIMIRCDDVSGAAIAFKTTEGSVSITGTQDWTEYELQLDNAIPAETATIIIFLNLLPESTGDIYFDDITYAYTE